MRLSKWELLRAQKVSKAVEVRSFFSRVGLEVDLYNVKYPRFEVKYILIVRLSCRI